MQHAVRASRWLSEKLIHSFELLQHKNLLCSSSNSDFTETSEKIFSLFSIKKTNVFLPSVSVFTHFTINYKKCNRCHTENTQTPSFLKKKLKTEVKTEQKSAVHSQYPNTVLICGLICWTDWSPAETLTHTLTPFYCFYSHMVPNCRMVESETWYESQEMMEVVASVSNSTKYGLIPAVRRFEQFRAECMTTLPMTLF